MFAYYTWLVLTIVGRVNSFKAHIVQQQILTKSLTSAGHQLLAAIGYSFIIIQFPGSNTTVF